VLAGWKFDSFVEGLCAKFYEEKIGHPSLAPGKYFRLLLIGYFEGIDSERGIAWRCADSLSLRAFVGYALDEKSTEHSTISRTRRLIDLETHREVFQWVLKVLADYDLVSGKTVGIDATTLEANAAMRSIVRKETKQNYQDFLTDLAKASGIETPTREDLVKLDRKRKNKASNDDWEMRRLLGIGKPRRLQGLFASIFRWILCAWSVVATIWTRRAARMINKNDSAGRAAGRLMIMLVPPNMD